MTRSKKTLLKNVNKNKEAIISGLKLYDDVYALTKKLLNDNKEMYDRVIINTKKFLDKREIEHIIMAYYLECFHNISTTPIFDENKYKEYIDNFLYKLSFDVSESEMYQKKFAKNSSKDELGLNVYERYYYDALEPYFDNVYKLLPKIEKINLDMFTKEGKYSQYHFFLKMYSYKFDQGFYENFKNDRNFYYYNAHYKNFDDVNNFKQEVFFNMLSHYLFNDILKEQDLMYCPKDENGVKFLTDFDESAVESYIAYLNNPEFLELQYDKELYRLLQTDEKGFIFDKLLSQKMTLFSWNSNNNFKLKNDYDCIYIDGVSIKTFSPDQNEMWRIVASKILEGNHAIEIVNVIEYDSKVKTEIIPVKFKHDNSEYNKLHYSWFERFLNFIGLKHSIRDISEIENNNFLDKQHTKEERYKNINLDILEKISKYNENAINSSNKTLGFECINQELNIYNKALVDVLEINDDIKEVEDKAVRAEKDLNKSISK